MMKTFGLAAIGALMATAAVPAYASQTFDFSFAAPLTNGPGLPVIGTASGSGTLVTDDADQNGHYNFLSVTGSFILDAGDSPRLFDTVMGVADGFYHFNDGFLVKDGVGTFVTSGIAFFNPDTFDLIAFRAGENGLYNGYYSEVDVVGATLTFTQAAAAVPEPATWGMMLLGFGAMGAALRRRPTVRVRFA